VSVVLLTYGRRAAAEARTENIVGNGENQRASGLELVGVRVVGIAASTDAIVS
jgi:hypothetical protein